MFYFSSKIIPGERHDIDLRGITAPTVSADARIHNHLAFTMIGRPTRGVLQAWTTTHILVATGNISTQIVGKDTAMPIDVKYQISG